MAQDRTPGEVIARTLCIVAEMDPDGTTHEGEPNWHCLRAHTVALEAALANAGFAIVPVENEA